MTNCESDVSLRQAAIIGGIAYLVMTVCAIIAEFSARSSLIDWGDAAATANNIADSEMLFRVGIACFAIVLLCDVIVAWALYVFLKPVNKSISLLTAWFRVVYTSIHGAALVGLVLALLLLTSADYSSVFEPGQLNALALLLLNGHDQGWLIGEVFFGTHLLLLGYLIFRSDYVPRILGVLLMIGGAAYLGNSFVEFLVADSADFESALLIAVAVPSAIGEFGLAVWLLVRGGKSQPQDGGGQRSEGGSSESDDRDVEQATLDEKEGEEDLSGIRTNACIFWCSERTISTEGAAK